MADPFKNLVSDTSGRETQTTSSFLSGLRRRFERHIPGSRETVIGGISVPGARRFGGGANLRQLGPSRLFSPRIGEDTIPFLGPGFSPNEGDFELSPLEGQELLVNGWYKQRGAKLGIDGPPGPKGPRIPTFEELRDDIAGFYERFVGTEASGEVEDHIYRKLAAGQSFESVEDDIQASSEFRNRYPGIEHQPQLTGPEYDATVRPFDAHFLENRGRVMNADEKRALFAVKTPDEQKQWITSAVKDEGSTSLIDVFKPKTQGRF